MPNPIREQPLGRAEAAALLGLGPIIIPEPGGSQATTISGAGAPEWHQHLGAMDRSHTYTLWAGQWYLPQQHIYLQRFIVLRAPDASSAQLPAGST